MRINLAFAIAFSLAALIAPVSAQARERRPVIPEELGVRSPLAPVWIPYRCSTGPVQNFYHRAYYGFEPPAIYLGYAYRPYYRYSAYRVVPRTYLCADE
jgi:hypothetical protein